MKGARGAFLALFDFYSTLSGALARVSSLACYLLLVVVTAVTGLAVFSRYVLSQPISWTEEIARYILIWLTMIAASVAIRNREHISLDSLVRRLSRKAATITELFVFAVIIVLLIIVNKYSLLMLSTQSVRRFSPSIQISMVWAHAALPVGFTLILLQSLFVVLDDLRQLIIGRPEATEPQVPEIE